MKNNAQRLVYIISDIHIGGRYPESDDSGGRGFRINTHVDALEEFVRSLLKKQESGQHVELVINGDFLDFLAEEDGSGAFVAFVDDPRKALKRLTAIVKRDHSFFNVLADFVRSGARLTLLLGNHDLELSLPHVRRELMRILNADDRPTRVSFFYDGEAYAIGNALIEHGNRYDGFNIVNHSGLRELRSMQSRGEQPTRGQSLFSAPPGSRLVASIMNRIKRDYAFVDLLKPETEAVIPLLLALEPGYRTEIPGIAALKFEADKHAPKAPGQPRFTVDLASTEKAHDPGDDALQSILSTVMGPEDARAFAASLPQQKVTGNLAASENLLRTWGLANLLTSNASQAIDDRLPALLNALRVLHDNRSFSRSDETGKTYLDAAHKFAENGFNFVIFGHTHLAKDVNLGNDCRYLNSGTWADIIEFPTTIVRRDNANAVNELREFVKNLADNRLASYTRFIPTYVRLAVDDDRVTEAILCDFKPGSDVP